MRELILLAVNTNSVAIPAEVFKSNSQLISSFILKLTCP